MRFAGIRKPRLGNSALLVMAQENGWLMGQGGSPAGTPDGSRNLNYSRADVREWYSYQNEGYLQDGVVGWWNDEAEDDYFTFTWWTLSERATFANSDIPNRRFVSINRAFAPGAARLGAVTWTGDISPQWEDLQRTPGYMLNWGLAGQPLVTCDTGGFAGESNALLLARWYGLSAFSPVMRVHSTIGSTPHFPFPELWGAEAATAMVAALNLRYRLLPHTYALAHEANRVGLPIMRPMAMEFPADPSLADVTAQFMYGGMILVAPVLTPDNATSAYLPADTWFEWDSARTHVGPTTLSLPAVPLGVTPAFVRSGAILSLAPAGLQYSDALPGGPLSIVVYGGKDGAHVMYDDDGETTDYETGAVATITFTWKDSTGCLSWVRAGTFAGGPRSFVQLTVTAYTTSGATKTAPATAIGVGGSVCPA